MYIYIRNVRSVCFEFFDNGIMVLAPLDHFYRPTFPTFRIFSIIFLVSHFSSRSLPAHM